MTELFDDLWALAVSGQDFALLSDSGEVETGKIADLPRHIGGRALLFCHRPSIAQALEQKTVDGLDILELFAFTLPTHNPPPFPAALLQAAGGQSAGQGSEQICLDLLACRMALLHHLASPLASKEHKTQLISIALMMQKSGWNWAGEVLQALNAEDQTLPPESLSPAAFLDHLPEWEDHPPRGSSGDKPITPEEAERQLLHLLGGQRRPRIQQISYSQSVAKGFQQVDRIEERPLILAEAGTGTGKTLGYLAPAGLWAQKNDLPVWISTYTRNLQQQIAGELAGLEQREQRPPRLVIRKGRENFLCLLNLDESLRLGLGAPQRAIAIGLMLRWALATPDGDLTGAGFPGWLTELFGFAPTLGLADQRGECIYAACPHYRRCFIERNRRTAQGADLVISNHALTMIQAAMAHLPGWDEMRIETGEAKEQEAEDQEERQPPPRLIFDEGHHLFDAADSAFAIHVTGTEAAELRRWLRGPETARRGSSPSRMKGLQSRLEDLADQDDTLRLFLADVLRAARDLPAESWLNLISDGTTAKDAAGDSTGLRFFSACYHLTLARAHDSRSRYDLEIAARNLPDDLRQAAGDFAASLQRLRKAMILLARELRHKLAESGDTMEQDQRRRIEASSRGLWRRGPVALSAWISVLESLAAGGGSADEAAQFVDWIGITRQQGRDRDTGVYRHWLDPGQPFAEVVLNSARSVTITSATLTDRSQREEDSADWQAARRGIGAQHTQLALQQHRFASPYDFARSARVYIITDVSKTDASARAHAYQRLMIASGGGTVALFTAIERLRRMREKLLAPLSEAGIALLAQHVDRLSVASLIALYRARQEAGEPACLLGTDALRDGVDIPGEALRMMILDRTPWPRPSLLHKARREAFGGRLYDAQLTRMRLKQAFGRLIRSETDRGIFVCLDAAIPSDLLSAFPEDVPIERLTLDEAIGRIQDFMANRVQEDMVS